jgi:hypothetical protein
VPRSVLSRASRRELHDSLKPHAGRFDTAQSLHVIVAGKHRASFAIADLAQCPPLLAARTSLVQYKALSVSGGVRVAANGTKFLSCRFLDAAGTFACERIGRLLHVVATAPRAASPLVFVQVELYTTTPSNEQRVGDNCDRIANYADVGAHGFAWLNRVHSDTRAWWRVDGVAYAGERIAHISYVHVTKLHLHSDYVLLVDTPRVTSTPFVHAT